MNRALEHKGYFGVVEFDYEDRTFYGEVVNILDVIAFEGRSVEELEESFRSAVDAYLELCAKQGKEPEKPFSGQLPLRTTPAVHLALAVLAQRQGKSMNELVNQALITSLQRSEVAALLETSNDG
jgi:predicted HicB family RNase H-like nuclease